MTDEVWKRDEIESPCVQLCAIHDAAGVCVGCYRTRHEIAGWSSMTPERRREIMAELPGRAKLLKAPENRPSRRRRGSHTNSR